MMYDSEYKQNMIFTADILRAALPGLIYGRYVVDGYGDHYRDTWIDYYHDIQGYITEPISTEPVREGVIPSTVNAVYTELHNAYMRAYNETQ